MKHINKLWKKVRPFLLLGLIFLTGCLADIERREQYNITEVEGDGLIKIIKLANAWTDDGLIFFFLLSLLIVAFLSLKSVTDAKRSMAAGMFITMIATFLIKVLDIAKNNELMDRLVIGVIVLFVFSAVALYLDRDEARF